jgi:hypothetical protein
MDIEGLKKQVGEWLTAQEGSPIEVKIEIYNQFGENRFRGRINLKTPAGVLGDRQISLETPLSKVFSYERLLESYHSSIANRVRKQTALSLIIDTDRNLYDKIKRPKSLTEAASSIEEVLSKFTLGDFLKTYPGPYKLLSIPNMGKVSVDAISKIILSMGYSYE